MTIGLITYAVIAQAINLQGLPNVSAGPERLQIILNIVFGIAGAIALLMVTVGGLRYVLSHGDPGQIAAAKNTIIYALVGLVVCIAAIGIVNFVVVGVT